MRQQRHIVRLSATAFLAAWVGACGGDEVAPEPPFYLVQSEADAEALRVVSDECFNGTIRISDSDLIDVPEFSALTCLTGDLVIGYNPQMLDVSGFQNLARIEGDLVIYENLALLDISGFASLEYAGSLELMSNPALVDPTGFGRLSEIGGLAIGMSFSAGRGPVWGEPTALETLDFLATVEVAESASIYDFSGLDFTAFDPVSLQVLSLNIYPDESGDLEGFNRVRVLDYLGIGTSHWRIAGFDSLRGIGPNHGLDISGSENLTHLGMSALRRVYGGVYISGNASLPECEIERFMDQLETPPVADASWNCEDCSCR